MLIAGYIMYALLNLVEEKFMKLIMPLAVLVIYCFFSRESGSIDVWGGSTILGISDALMRAFAGMSLGGICYSASNLLKQKQLDKTKKILLSIGEMAAFVLAFALMSQAGHTQVDFYVIGLLAIAVTISFSGVTYTSKFFDIQLFSWLGKISYSMFLNQILVIYLMGAYLIGFGYTSGVLIFMLLLFVISLVEIAIIEGMKKISGFNIKN
jgi:peptidoglycan/LPS O-acetylase OafA/YrhL